MNLKDWIHLLTSTSIRQAIMCQGDLSLYHYKWIPGRAKPMPLASQQHVCIDWDNMIEWSAERTFSLNDRLLKAPDAGMWLRRWTKRVRTR